jgi:hypothetical protein
MHAHCRNLHVLPAILWIIAMFMLSEMKLFSTSVRGVVMLS